MGKVHRCTMGIQSDTFAIGFIQNLSRRLIHMNLSFHVPRMKNTHISQKNQSRGVTVIFFGKKAIAYCTFDQADGTTEVRYAVLQQYSYKIICSPTIHKGIYIVLKTENRNRSAIKLRQMIRQTINYHKDCKPNKYILVGIDIDN